MFVARFDRGGTTAWVTGAGYLKDEVFGQVALSPVGDVYLSGAFISGIRLGSKFVEPVGNNDGFLAKIVNSTPGLSMIVAQPVSGLVANGAQTVLQVTATSTTPATYQWFFNDKPISGATSASYTIASVTAANEGYYFVEVTNAAGTVRSASAQLVIKGQAPVLVTTVAGTNSFGYADSPDGAKVRFYNPNGLAYLSQGLFVVADSWNHLVRIMDPSGAVEAYAGQTTPGLVNGPARSAAKFNFPLGVAVEKSLDVVVADTENNVVRRINSFGLHNVSTVAGSGQRGYKNGAAADAQFNFPNDIVTDSLGNIFVTEFNNHTVRKIAPDGAVSTLAGNGTAGYQDGAGAAARFNQPGGLAIDPAGNLYVTEWSGQRVRKVTPQGLVTTLAGTNRAGFADGQGSAALFHTPDGVAVDPLGNLYVAEHDNHAIRKIDPSGNVTTVAGLGVVGFKDGDKGTALFNSPGGVMWHPSGSLYVSDTANHSIRRIDFLNAPPNPDGAELLISLNPTLTIFGKPGKTYRIEGAESGVTPLDWTVLDTITLAHSAEMWCDPQPATRAKRYYRAILLP